jgi:hypothetical protein
MTPPALAPDDELRAQVDDLDRRLCELVVQRTTLTRQLPTAAAATTSTVRRDFAGELHTLARYNQRRGPDGVTLALLLIRRGIAAPATVASAGLSAAVTGPTGGTAADGDPPHFAA